jgi:hypothetical protein
VLEGVCQLLQEIVGKMTDEHLRRSSPEDAADYRKLVQEHDQVYGAAPGS